MASKRALIVDDSKSARSFLSRILEKYALEVDATESAESAIEYLTRHRPDVIFMDHLMPGMDGFQAVQAIKSNPRTATIPIMMYTSQEGELYLGQARALGAVGVLPKQIRPVDVSKVLYQLGLLPDRRTVEQTTFTLAEGETQATAAPAAAAAAPAAATPSPELRAALEPLLRAQTAELRRFVVANLDNQAERIVGDLRGLVEDLAPPPPAAPASETPRLPPRDARPSLWPWGVAIASLLAGLVLGAMWWRELRAHEALVARVAELRAELTVAQAAARAAEARLVGPAPDAAALRRADRGAPRATAAAEAARSAAMPDVLIERVPYGELPLAGARIERLRELLARLETQGFRGIVEVRSFPGRFCLVGNAADGFSLAPEEADYARCDLVGNPADDALGSSPRESLDFANMIARVRRTTGGALDVRVAGGSAESTAIAYPAVGEKLTAGEWNRAALANNRIEVRLRAAR